MALDSMQEIFDRCAAENRSFWQVYRIQMWKNGR